MISREENAEVMVGYWAECRPSGPGQERATADVPGSQLECPESTLLRGKADGRQAPQKRAFSGGSETSANDPIAEVRVLRLKGHRPMKPPRRR